MTPLDIGFGLASVIGMLIAIFQTIKANNQEKELAKYKYLFDIAGKGIEKDETEEQLRILKDEKQKMDEAINKEIPLKAHLTVLFDRLKDDESNLVTYYKRYVDTKQEYDRLSNEEHCEIPKSLIKEIEDQILPDYVLKEKKENCLKMLTIISYISALLSINGWTRHFSNVFLVVSIVPLVRLGKLSLPKDPQKREEFFLTVFRDISAIVTIVMAFITVAFYMSNREYYGGIHYNAEGPFSILLAITFVFLSIAMLLTQLLHKRKQNE